jgi:hypothetical protein
MMVVYSLSFAVVDPRLLIPALLLGAVSLLYFPIYLAVSWTLKLGPLERNLFLPFNIALIVGAVTNVVSVGSPAFFAVMFVTQIFILAVGFFWSAYEFTKEGRIWQFAISFGIWFMVVVSVDTALSIREAVRPDIP